MNVRQYEGETLRACLEQVRADLGPEAVIIETRKLKKGGVLGVGSRDTVRIIAAAGTPGPTPQPVAAPPAATTAVVRRPAPARRQAVPQMTAANQDISAPATQQPTLGSLPPEIARLAVEIQELRRSLQQMRVRPEHDKDASDVYSGSVSLARRILAEAEVEPDLASELIEGVPDLDALQEDERAKAALSYLQGRLAARIPTAGPIAVQPSQQKRVALIGPTGVGKTTTIAKLAAHYALNERRTVGLLTLDTYRIAAIEQLRTYAQLLAIPLRVIYSASEAPATLTELQDRDLILIDTAGRSQKHSLQMQELRALLEATQCETHLVLSATTKCRDLHDQVARFAQAGVDRLVFTKLDETSSLGALVSVAMSAGIPLSYLTAGQKVPEDIEVAEAGRIAEMTLAQDHG